MISSRHRAVLAVDGGGTKTLLVVARMDGTIAEVRRAAGTNPFDGPSWRPVLTELLTNLPDGIEAAGLGLPGYGEDAEHMAAQDALVHTMLAAPTSVMNDVEMACRGAFAGQPGILLLSGTGSMAWRVGADGAQARVGGWGALFGDEGSACWIGREMLTVLSQAIDGRAPIPPQDVRALLSLIDAPDTADPMSALLRWYARLTSPRAEVAALAKGVDGLAMRGCTTAKRILDAAADQLAMHLRVLRCDGATSWSYGGSVLSSQHILARLSDEFGAPAMPLLPPVGGGLLRAATLAGWAVDAQWIARLSAALHAENIS